MLPPVVIIPLSITAGVASLLAFRWVYVAATGPERRALLLISGLWGISAVHTAVVVMQIGHFSHVTGHYYGWLLITWCTGVAMGAVVARRRLPPIFRSGAVSAAIVVTIVLIHSTSVIERLRMSRDPDELRNVRTELIGWIDSHLPAGAPIASWNAGQLGYFLDRPVVNLDGLVNDRAYLESLRRHEPVLSYLNREGIGYIVDYNDQDLSMRYREAWDKSRFFRGDVSWESVETLYARRADDKTVYVLRTQSTGSSPRH